jgi:hypothetical protein
VIRTEANGLEILSECEKFGMVIDIVTKSESRQVFVLFDNIKSAHAAFEGLQTRFPISFFSQNDLIEVYRDLKWEEMDRNAIGPRQAKRKAIVIDPIPLDLDLDRFKGMLNSRGVVRIEDERIVVFPRNSAYRRQILGILAKIPVEGLKFLVIAVSPREFPEELRNEGLQSKFVVIIDPLPVGVGEKELVTALTNLGGYEMEEGLSGVELGGRRLIMRFERVKGHKIALKFLKRHQVGGVILPCVKCAADEIPEPLEPGMVS